MTEKPDFKTLRAYVKAESRRSQAWSELDRLLTDDVAPVEHMLAVKKTEISALEKQIETLAAKVVSAKAEAQSIVENAQHQGDAILLAARATQDAAKEEKRVAGEKAETLIGEAEKQAAEIIQIARIEAKEINAAIGKIRSVL